VLSTVHIEIYSKPRGRKDSPRNRQQRRQARFCPRSEKDLRADSNKLCEKEADTHQAIDVPLRQVRKKDLGIRKEGEYPAGPEKPN